MKERRYSNKMLNVQNRKERSKKLKFSSLKLLFPYLRTHWKKVIIASILMIILSLLALPTPYLMKYIVDDVILAKNIKLLNLIIFLLIGIQFFKLIFSFLTNYLFSVFNQEILVKIKKDLFHRLLRLPLSFFDSQQTGYLLSRIGEVEGLGFFFSNSIVRILIGILEFLFCLWILLYLNWRLTLISLIVIPFLYFATRFYSRSIRKTSRELMEKGANLSKRIQESLSGVEVIKSFSAEDRETTKIHISLDELKQTSIKRNIQFTISSEILSLIGALGGFIVLWYSGWKIIKGSFTIGTYIAFSAYLAKLYGPTQILANIGLTLQPAITTLNRVSELFELGEEGEEGIRVSKLTGEIEFRDVYFSYDSKKEGVLKGITLKINPGDKILIAGPNGSGKSTIVKLILGLYKIDRGKITIDGHDINTLSLSSLRERISFVSQNVFLFNDTIRNNILYSRPDASEMEVKEAAKLSGAHEFIMNLEDGFNTPIGETGKKLSGGERKKISIARAILKDSDIIIFDEATSELDSESERRIEELITEHFKYRTCIIISHRAWRTNSLNRIYLLGDGRVLDQGSHDELSQRNPYYRELHRTQARS
ncbi:MAG: ABC transporter ATP-binding protein [Acidobacteriota bacterium]